ncbi:MAG: hypothetical protein AAGG02_01560 [Cyanobacteria bacterium P01_H01_bin.15]
MLKKTLGYFIAGAVVTCSVQMAAMAQSEAPKVQDLVGALGRSGEEALESRGYRYLGGSKADDVARTFYREAGTNNCLQVITDQGRYQSLLYIPEFDCEQIENTQGQVNKNSQAGDASERVSFRAGSTGTTVTGELGSSQGVRYLLNARDGQFLRVSLRPNNPYTNYIIYVPGGDILFESSQGGDEYYGQLYLTGDHVVEVFYNGNVDTVGKYDIEFEIDDGPTSALPKLP